MVNIEELQSKLHEVDEKAAILDEKDYKEDQISVKIRCGSGHSVKIRIDKIINKTWICRSCIQQKHTIETFREIAENRNGKCLSEAYVGLNKHLLFECESNHVWKATPNNIKNKNSWCPQCKDLVNQERCRVIFEFLFPSTKFITCCPDFLYVEETKKTLELDGYSDELKLAFEYQGIHHYELMYFDNDDDTRLKHQQEKDKLKVDRCVENGIKLIVISYRDVKFKSDEAVKSLIINALLECNVELEKENLDVLEKANIQQFVKTNNSKVNKYKKEVLNILNKNKGRLENADIKIVHNRLTKFNIICRFGHIFETTRERLMDKRERWCPDCHNARNRKIKVSEENITLTDRSDYRIIDLDKFGKCAIRCVSCQDEQKNIDIDDIPNKCAQTHNEIKESGEIQHTSQPSFQPIKHSKLLRILEKNPGFIQAGDYINAKLRMKLKCPNNHIIDIIPDNISKLTCKKCKKP